MTSLAQLISQHWLEVVTFLLIFGRTMGVILGAPFWGSHMIPVAVRIWVAIVLAVAIYPLAKAGALPTDLSLLSLFMALAGEIFLGLMLGWLAQMLFAGVRLAGQAIESKSGLGLIQLFDPHEGGQTGVFSAFLELIAGMIFFAVNGHHLLIQALASSYTVFPLAGEKFMVRVAAGLVNSAGEIFTIALRISAPVLIGLLLTDIVLGIISRAIPQMNVFMVAQPVQFGFAMLLLVLSLPAVVWFIARQIPLTIGVPGGVG
ncbi:MAG: flagellar biosynthetic protein FliR [Candidatus Binatia bacterium]